MLDSWAGSVSKEVMVKLNFKGFVRSSQEKKHCSRRTCESMHTALGRRWACPALGRGVGVGEPWSSEEAWLVWDGGCRGEQVASIVSPKGKDFL